MIYLDQAEIRIDINADRRFNVVILKRATHYAYTNNTIETSINNNFWGDYVTQWSPVSWFFISHTALVISYITYFQLSWKSEIVLQNLNFQFFMKNYYELISIRYNHSLRLN